MEEFVYTVRVRTDTQEHADEVIRERIFVDEDYGFEYEIEAGQPAE